MEASGKHAPSGLRRASRHGIRPLLSGVVSTWGATALCGATVPTEEREPGLPSSRIERAAALGAVLFLAGLPEGRAEGGETYWAWMKGPSAGNRPGVYGEASDDGRLLLSGSSYAPLSLPAFLGDAG